MNAEHAAKIDARTGLKLPKRGGKLLRRVAFGESSVFSDVRATRSQLSLMVRADRYHFIECVASINFEIPKPISEHV